MELREQLQSALGGTYAIDRELARGGMARVFVATERALGRTVVIKLVSPELAAGVSASRFEREIRLAASLQQANIVPLLSAGVAAGLPYYTMPFVDGLSLRDRLDGNRAMPIPEVVGVLRDVARALAYAHERGVVHRDIKPDNVLLSRGTAVVTDFGIAKAISAARTEPGDVTLTQAGTGVGTPAYMAPEQAAGDPATDHRADVYAFGCLAYELLTGKTPFHGRTMHQTLAAHFAEQAPRVAAKRPDAPLELSNLVARCLEKNPDDRPRSGAELLSALESPSMTAFPAARSSRRVVLFGVGAAALVLLGTGAFVAMSRRGRLDPSVSSGRVLAVLPFLNVGGDSTQEYFADGLADELATALGKVDGMQIASRSSSYQYKGRRDVDARVVARSLGASYVIQGSVRREGDRVRVGAHLTRASDNQEIWQDSYNEDARNAFAVEDTIVHSIAAALAPRFAGRGTSAIPGVRPAGATSHPTPNPEAHDVYLRARFLLLSRRSVSAAADLFEQAIAKDPTFARAYSGLAEALEYLPYFDGTPAGDIRDRVDAAARKALGLDSAQAEAHIALGLMHSHAWEWQAADTEFRRALAIDPTDASAFVQYARYLLDVGRPLEALTALERAQQLDPVSGVAAAWMVGANLALGRVDAAIAQSKIAREIDSTIAPAIDLSALAYAAARRYDDAIRLERAFRRVSPPLSANLAFLLGRSGMRDSAFAMVREVEQRPATPSGEIVVAFAYLGLRDTARALDGLERATALHAIWPSYAGLCDFQYDVVRSTPRFAALVARVRLDARIFASPQACRRAAS